MAFQPFGYRFEIKSPSSPAVVKAAIRSRKRGWFDAKDGARGWILGPFMCLWLSAFDSRGPMLFGRITRDKLGTRISGRAGSDLNGLAMACVLLSVLALLWYPMLADGAYSTKQIAITGGGLMALFLLVFWTKHAFRRDAEPLVRFVRDVVTASGRPARAKSATVAVSKALTLDVGGETREGPVTPDAIHDALVGLGTRDFVILASGPETYIQSASHDGGYVLEMRKGDELKHFQAVRRTGARAAACAPEIVFTFEEALEAFLAYAAEAPMPRFLSWERMPLAE